MQRWLLVLVLMLSFTSIAAAQPEATSAASQAAQKAFDEGMELMKAKRFDEACIKLEESQRLEAGMGTLFRLAQCYEAAGRLASAWKSYDAVATAARAARLRAKDAAEKEDLAKRESYSQERADALVASVARGAIRVPSDVALLPGLAVSVDGVIVPPASWGNVPLDRGLHRIVVQARGKRPYEAELTIAKNGERVTVQIPPLVDAPADTPEQPKPKPPDQTSDETIHTLTIVGIAVGVVGLAGLGTGIGLGFAAKAKHDDSAPFCNDNSCQQEGVDIRDDALALGTIGTGVFIAGSVLTAAGIGMVIAGVTMSDDTGDDVDDITAELSVSPTGAAVLVRF